MFDFLRLAHPPLGPQPVRVARLSMRVPVTDRIGLPLPILAYDLPWFGVGAERAASVADALDELGVAVAALRCELGYEAATAPPPGGARPDPKTSSPEISNRFCPYRPDRYGLRLDDLTTAKVIDIRLAPRRGGDGLLGYSPEQMRRWDLRVGRMADSGNLHQPAMPAMLWPPDVPSLEKMASKVAELRQLAPAAAICLSLGADALQAGLPIVVRSGADVLAIRADDWPPESGPQLATQIVHARRWLEDNGGGAVHLVVVPPRSVEAIDSVKLLALGADMVAVDGWCEPLLNVDRGPEGAAEDWAVATLGVSTRPKDEPSPAVDTGPLRRRIEQMTAVVESAGVASVTELGPEHLVSLGPCIPGIRNAHP